VLPGVQNLCSKCTQWLRRDARVSFRGEGLEGSTDLPKIYDFSFSLKIVPLKQCYCYKNNTLCRLRPLRITETPNDLLKWRLWQLIRRHATADSSINDQLIKMHSTHSWIKCVLSSSISYFVVCCFQRKMFNTTKLLNFMVSFVELIMHKWAIWYW